MDAQLNLYLFHFNTCLVDKLMVLAYNRVEANWYMKQYIEGALKETSDPEEIKTLTKIKKLKKVKVEKLAGLGSVYHVKGLRPG